MNYIKQLNAFFDKLGEISLSATAQALYQLIMSVNNRCGWAERFGKDSNYFMSTLGVTRNTFRKARQELVENGLITFKARKGITTVYSVTQLYKEGEILTPLEAGEGEILTLEGEIFTRGGSNFDPVEGQILTPYLNNNLNITKQDLNKESYVPENGNEAPSPPVPKRREMVKFTEQHLLLATLLKTRILENKPDYKTPRSLDSWANTVRLMIEQDKRAPERIKLIINWCQQNEFWRKNILSMGTLREKFDRLEMEMNSPKGGKPSGEVRRRIQEDYEESFFSKPLTGGT